MTTAKMSRRRLMQWGIAGAAIVVVIAVALTIASVSGIAWAANSGSAASYWHIGYYAPSGRALSLASAPAAHNGVATLNFTNQTDTALLLTGNKGKFPSLLGNLAGKTVSASFTVSGLNPGQYFIYYNEPNPSGNVAVTVRYFFETTNSGGFDETHYWWSNPASANLNTVTGLTTLPTVTFDGSKWSDFYGHFGNDPTYADAFNAAVSNVTMIGLSFGGGSGFENGIGTSDGSGTLTLNSFTVGS